MSIYSQITKHKNFSGLYPYTYFIKQISTGIKYYGVRWANKVSPSEDLGIHYFTSGKLANDFKNNPEDFTVRLHYTFDNKEDAIAFESLINAKIIHKPDWANSHAFPSIINTVPPNQGKRWYNNGVRNFLKYPDMAENLIPGRLLNPDSYEKITNGWKSKFSDSELAAISRAKNKTPSPVHPLKGKKKSEDHKRKLSESQKGRKRGKITDPGTLAKMAKASRQKMIGRNWFNDGHQNFMLAPDDPRRETLIPGRILSDDHKEKIITRNKSESQRQAIRKSRTKN